MDDFIKFISEFNSKSARFIMTTVYLAMCVLIANRTCNLIGIYYIPQTDINMAIILNFIMTGQFLLPLILFSILFIGIYGFNYFLLKFNFWFGGKYKKYDDVYDVSIRFMVDQKFIKKDNQDRILKGENFGKLKEYFLYFNDLDYDIVAIACMINTLIFCFLIGFTIYPINNFWVKIIVIILLILGYIYTRINIFILMKVKTERLKYGKLIDDLEQNDIQN